MLKKLPKHIFLNLKSVRTLAVLFIFFALANLTESATFTVTSANDSGTGSLRQGILNSASGDNINFTNTLSGATITLTSGELPLGHNLTIDGSLLTSQVKLNGNHASRIFDISGGVNVTLNSLILTNCYPGAGNSGGAIYNVGTLALNNCTLSGNSVDSSSAGGAIVSSGPLTLTGCTLSGNSAGFAGAINNTGALCSLLNCTLSGNVCANNGGAIDNTFSATLSLLHCTVSSNTAGGAGGGIDNYLSLVNLTNTIVAGNSSQDIYNWASSTNIAGGTNIVPSLGNAGTLIGGSSILTVNPLLAPLGNYGGLTQTMPPLTASPAIDSAAAGALTTDQRGYVRPIGAGPDIGAVEVSSPANSPFGNAMLFNGTNQYVTVPNFGAIIPTNEITVEFWAYTTMAAGQSAFMLNPDQGNNRLNGHLNYGGPAPDVGATYWDFGNISGNGRLGPASAPANSISNWVHYAFVASQSGNYMSVYTNGVLCATKSGMTPFVRGNYSLQIGGPGFPYHGRLDEFRVWNAARSQAQILANLGTTLTGNESNLLLYYRFDDNGANPAANSATATGAAYNGTTVNSPGLANATEPFTSGLTAGSLAYTFTTFAGGSAVGSSDGAGDAARFANPHGVAVDTNGNLYVADFNNHTIRKITSAGVVTTLAGLAGSPGSADGIIRGARFNQPFGIAVDGSGNVYVADSMNATIRKITPAGTVSTIAGLAGFGGAADGTNGLARFNNPFDIAIDNSGLLYVADEGNFTIRKITPIGTNWVTSTLAGKPNMSGSTDGTGTNALFNGPFALTVDKSGNIYVCDPPVIRKITSAGVVTTIAGSTSGTIDGVGTNAQFYSPFGIVADSLTNLFVADGNGHTVRKITPVGTNWVVATFAGKPNSNGATDGTGTNATFGTPWGIAADISGNLFVADELYDNIRELTSAGVVTTFAGPENSSSYLDGTGIAARFNSPAGVTVDNSGNLYVADSQNRVIRKITPAGVVSTLAGQVGVTGDLDGVGNQAQFNVPYGIVADHSGNIYVTENFSTGKIRQVTPAGVVTTIAGTGAPGYIDGLGTTAQFRNPAGIAIDQSGNLYVAEQANNTIRMIAPVGTNWVVSTIAGYPLFDNDGNPIGGYVDGTGTNARFNLPSVVALPSQIILPSEIAVDNAGNIYVADGGNHVIRKIYSGSSSRTNPANWTVTTLAGLAGVGGSGDGTGVNALFGGDSFLPGPAGVAVDNSGNVFVADDGNNTIRKITPAGVVTTLAGLPGTAGSVDGSGSNVRFNLPSAIALNSAGDIYVVDQGNNTIRKGTFTQYGPTNLASVPQPAMNSQIKVTLLPPEANGQWRFPWEVAWRNSGQTASNLVAGNYPVEFRNFPGWLAIPSSLTVGVTNSVSLTNQYFPTISTVDTNDGGTLTVTLGPSPPAGAGWRFLGDSTPFYSSGYSTNLPVGTYLIEFAAVSGRVKPANLSVQIQAGQATYLAENYLLSQAAPSGVLLPFPVPANNISNLGVYPFGFNGQLQSDTGYGSGVAVQNNVVLTAAHVVFNDQTLAYVSQAYWYNQREAGTFEPEPLAARGWYVLSGYAAQRTNDLQVYSPDTSTPQSRNLDVAALYFISPAAGGGYGGYLPSDASPNPWLTGNSLKMLAGYPVDGSQFGDASIVPGEMYQTDPQPYALTLATEPVANQQVYTANWFLSYPGNSGGPVYAQLNGYYYPAGVYLGTLYNGVTPYASVVRAIDSSVVDLITNAAALGDNGTNNTGGGVITIIPNQVVSLSNPGYLQFQVGPPAAVAAGAAWKLQGDTVFSSATNYTRAVVSTNAFSVQFKPVNGWNLPTNQTVSLQPGQITTKSAFYTVTNPMLVFNSALGIGITGTTGTVYRIETRTNFTIGAWAPVSTNTIVTNGFNLLLPKPATNGSVHFYRAVWLQ